LNLTVHFFVNARKKYNNARTVRCTGKRGAPVLKNKFRLGGISQHLSPFRLSQAIGVGAWVFTKDNMFFFIKNSTMKGEALCEVAQHINVVITHTCNLPFFCKGSRGDGMTGPEVTQSPTRPYRRPSSTQVTGDGSEP
jgi:hypothetical protein